jgi:hypothetical protein
MPYLSSLHKKHAPYDDVLHICGNAKFIKNLYFSNLYLTDEDVSYGHCSITNDLRDADEKKIAEEKFFNDSDFFLKIDVKCEINEKIFLKHVRNKITKLFPNDEFKLALCYCTDYELDNYTTLYG